MPESVKNIRNEKPIGPLGKPIMNEMAADGESIICFACPNIIRSGNTRALFSPFFDAFVCSVECIKKLTKPN